MTASAIEGLLREAVGLDAASIGSEAVSHAVRIRMNSLGIFDEEQYLANLLASAEERKELIETIVVPETWFFRHPDAFRILAETAATKWLPSNPAAVIRIASVACSTRSPRIIASDASCSNVR